MTSVGNPVTRKTRLLAEPCSTCILNPVAQRIPLSNKRITEFVQETLAADSYVVCHSTLPSLAAPGVEPAVCRGFYDRFSTTPLQLMERLWGFEEVAVVSFERATHWPVPCGATRGPRSVVRCGKPALHGAGCPGDLKADGFHAGRGRLGQWYFWSAKS